ncbi:MAG: hypothetical protein AAGC74_11150, partial [Verrucomicrobiota bacterium]
DFLSCNPAIPLSRFAMESKNHILTLLHPPHPEKIRTATYDFLRSSDTLPHRLDLIQQFSTRHPFPLILKPDIGERGRGVTIINDLPQAQAWLEQLGPHHALVQEYIPGPEFGLQWSHHPDWPEGKITSLARKIPQSLTGDGHHTLEQLILRDPRARAMAKHFFDQFCTELDRIPSLNEQIPLTQLGTHCLGAVFEDARHLITPALTETLNQLATHSPGIHFGRYDLRVPSEDHLQRGQGLVILELNGVTGEPAHIYQPDFPLLQGLRDLKNHYHLASQIGHHHTSNGHPPTSLKTLLATIRAHRQYTQDFHS